MKENFTFLEDFTVMKLSNQDIGKIALGAVRQEEVNGSLRLHRFTKEEGELYRLSSEAFYKRALSPAGVKLLFKTDSKNLFLKLSVSEGPRSYFSTDVYKNGEEIGCISNFREGELLGNYASLKFPLGSFSGSFPLGEGEKTVCIYMPWSVCADITELSLDDGAYVEPIKPKKKLVAYGDSITQGFDSRHPAKRYVARLAEALGAEEINKAIGGEKFIPGLVALASGAAPDYVTVAYGTNDWYRLDKEYFLEKCKAFFINLKKAYPKSKIFVITPIWRKNMHEARPFGDFLEVDGCIRACVGDVDGISVISGFDLVPHEEKYFGDLSLHPNDEGFEIYFENLYSKIKELL